MSYFDISHAARKALKAIEESELEKCINKCLYEEQSYYLQDFRLYDCGPYVTQQLCCFEKAVTTLRMSKSSKNAKQQDTQPRKLAAIWQLHFCE